MGPDEGKVCQWTFPKVTLTDLEKRMILASVMRIAVITMFNTHIYSFDNTYYLQRCGGPIGLRGTCAVARLAMIEWARRWATFLAGLGLSYEEAARYMDDLRVYMSGDGMMVSSAGQRSGRGKTGAAVCCMLYAVCCMLYAGENMWDYETKYEYSVQLPEFHC